MEAEEALLGWAATTDDEPQAAPEQVY